MTDASDQRVKLDVVWSDDAGVPITPLARRHDISAAAEPVDTFVEAATRLYGDAEVTFDHTERLLLGLARAGIVTDEQRFALHAAYLRQTATDVPPIR